MGFFSATYFGGNSSLVQGETPPAISKDITLNVSEGHIQTIITEDYRDVEIVFVVEDATKTVVYSVDDATLEKLQNAISFVVTEDITSIHTRYIYSIRRVSDNKVLQKGKLRVEYAVTPL